MNIQLFFLHAEGHRTSHYQWLQSKVFFLEKGTSSCRVLCIYGIEWWTLYTVEIKAFISKLKVYHSTDETLI